MKKWIALIILTLSFLANSCRAAEPLTAIGILLEPDDTMVVKARADNARLRKNFPEGFALDESHIPHITVIQCYVRTRDLDQVFAAVKRVTEAGNPSGMELSTTGYLDAPWSGPGLAGIKIAPTPELLQFQQAVLAVILPSTVKNGTVAAFVPNEDGKKVSETTAAYVKNFISKHTGVNYQPHVTVGLGREESLKELIASPYTPFSFKIKSVGIYQLGDFGAARKKLWTSSDDFVIAV